MTSKANVVGGISAKKQGKCRTSLSPGRASLAVVLAAVALTLGLLTTVDAQAATPKTVYVSQTGLNSGGCTVTAPCATVSYALTKATSGGTIKVSGTIDDHLVISAPVTVTPWVGGPAGSSAVLNGTFTTFDSVVEVASGVSGVTLEDLTIENGYDTNGGGILNNGTLTLTDSTVSGNGNSSDLGGGIYNGGTMTITDSTIANNTAEDGGGIFNVGTMTILASTISANTCTGTSSGCSSGGIYSGNGHTAVLGATIAADNTGGNCDGYDTSSLSSVGFNLTNDTTGTACAFTALDLVNKSPLLGPLASNGGPTQTMLPALTSPAADVIHDPTTLEGVAVCPGTDQRGVIRPGQGETGCTIGAVEVGATSPTTTSVSLLPATTVTSGTTVAYVVTVVPTAGTGTPTGKVTFKIGKVVLCKAVLSGGVAACGATSAPVGVDTVTGTYSGGGDFAGSAGTATLAVTS